MAKIPVPSHHVIDIVEEKDKVILHIKNGFKFICRKSDFSNFGKYKASILERNKKKIKNEKSVDIGL